MEPPRGGRDPLRRGGEHPGEAPVGGVDPAVEVAERVVEALGDLRQPVGVGSRRTGRPDAGGEVAQPARRDLAAEGAGRGVGQCVRLVDDDDVVGREERPARGQVREVEGVVHDEDVGALGAVAGVLGEAVVTGGAPGRAGALLGATRHGPPHPRWDLGVGGVAGLGLRREALQTGELGREVGAGPLVEQRVAAHRGVQPGPAQVLGSTLQHRGLELDVAVVRDEREVLAPQLVLQREGRGGDHRGPPRHDDRGQVGEALARPRRGLRHEMVRFVQRRGDGLGQEPLTGTVVAAESPHAPVEDGECPGLRHTSETTGRHAT